MTSFPLQIVTPGGQAYDGMAQKLFCRTITGDVAILARHCDYLTAVGMGEARVTAEDGTVRRAACIGGMLSVAGGRVRLMANTFEWAEDIDAARIGMLKPTEEEHQTGSAEVRDTFKVPKVGIAAGCMITEGEISRDDNVRLVRDGIVVFDGKIASLRRYKDDVKSVKAGFECGIGLENYQDIKPGDVIEGYKIVEVARTE